VFKNLSETLKWQDELASQKDRDVPGRVGLFVTGVTFFLMIYLVPQLTSFVKNMGNTLPLHTKALIFVSNIFIDYWYIMLALPLRLLRPALLAGARASRRATRRRLQAAHLAGRPGAAQDHPGPLCHLLCHDVRVRHHHPRMHPLSEGIVGNRVVAAGLRRAAQQISEGTGITAAFQNTGIFPPLVIRMLKVGEATGALDGALRNVSYFYNREVKEMIEKVQSMIEPAITVVLGVMVGWIMLSVMGPIYDTISKIRT
jgi:type IV pilus assembly protein PilC